MYVDPDEELSRNFTVREFIRSATAKRKGLDNRLVHGSPEHAAAVELHLRVVQPARDVLGPLFITSGFRGEALNQAVGGVPDSQHRLGEADDLASGRMPPIELAHGIVDCDVPFDQLILEHDQDVVHVSHAFNGEQRGEVLTRYVDARGSLQYVNGLVDEGVLT